MPFRFCGVKEKKRRGLVATFLLTLTLTSGPSLISTAFAADEDYWRGDQADAMKLARDGNYGDALPVLKRLHKEHPDDLDSTRDYLTVLDWSGQDDQVISLYNSLPDDREPDYVLLAAGHAFRLQNKADQAVLVYRKGLKLYPSNNEFAIGEIRSLIDSGKYMEATQASNDAIASTTKSKDLNSVVLEAKHVYAVSEAREGRYPEALKILGELHSSYPEDERITRDYLAVEAWSGDNEGAIALYKTLAPGQQPDYVYAAVGKAYRDMKQPADAAAIYHEALGYYPSNHDFQIAEVNSMIEAGHSDEATAAASSNLQKDQAAPEGIKESLEHAQQSQILVQQETAVNLARNGKYKEALALLMPLVRAHPEVTSLKQDYIAVLSWSGHDSDAVHHYESYGHGDMPDFVLLAVAHSYRDLKKYKQAYEIYKKGHEADPANEAFTVGMAACLMDMKQYSQALKVTEDDLHKHGNRVDVLIIASAAADASNKIYDALTYAQRAVELDPKNRTAVQAQIHAEQRVGASDIADELAAKQHVNLGARAHGEIQGDMSANLVRWGKLEPINDTQRFKGSDQAIEELDRKIQVWQSKSDANYPDLIRARFDRIVALRDRYRMQEVVTEYEALRQQGVAVPAYVLGPVGDAYLYLRHPEAARDVYLEALKSTPDDFEIRRQLFFAYVECDDFYNAYATIDKLRDDQPMWYYLKGEPERQPNSNRMVTEIDAANARLYSDELQKSSEMLTPVANNAPGDVHTKEALGSLDLTRGWPRAALDEFRLGTRVQNGTDVGTQTGAALAELDMRNYAVADQHVQTLDQEYPENLDLQRAQRQVDVYKMAELHVNSFYNMRSSNSAQGGEGYGVDTDLYSAPIDYNWRIFAGTGYAHEDEPNNEGAVGYEQSHAGVEYRDVNLLATLAPTYNVYHKSQRAGVSGDGEWTFNDYWSAGGGYESFSNDTPLRALNAGVTASKADANFEWRQSEAQEVRFDGDLMPFSDGNNRYEGSLTYSKRLYTNPYWRVDGLVDGSASHNTGNENRNYFNPETDTAVLAGARVTQSLYRRYETTYEHSLQLTPGLYWQENYGASPAATVTYQQTLNLSDTLEIGAGISYTHQDYDGVVEDNVSFLTNIVKRF